METPVYCQRVWGCVDRGLKNVSVSFLVDFFFEKIATGSTAATASSKQFGHFLAFYDFELSTLLFIAFISHEFVVVFLSMALHLSLRDNFLSTLSRQ